MTTVNALNTDCFCFSLDQASLAQALDAALGQAGLAAAVRSRCPHLFSGQPVFVAKVHLQRMAEVVAAVEAVVAMPAFVQQVLAAAPAVARVGAGQAGAGQGGGPLGVFFGYDFHLDHGRLGLIEVNTNAGGAMLNAVLARAQRACCPALQGWLPTAGDVQAFETRLVQMFQQEWQLAGHTRPLATIAIVDEAPEQQYLYPEFQLFEQLFQRHGLQAVITDPAALQWRAGRLWAGELAIDLVYNRLTDFYLAQASSAALREAWVAQAVVLTPNPRTHALYADKRHLALFSDEARLQALGVPEAIRQVLLAHVPRTEVVRPDQADRLWAERRGLFFKPVAGFGSRAAYRGDKLTKRVWQDILAGDYVAQALVPPGERVVPAPLAGEQTGESDPPTSAGNAGPWGGPTSGPVVQTLKFDLRAYAYAGQVQWLAARLYQGQTTNFRTPGGGFAPVYSLPGEGAIGGPGEQSDGACLCAPPSCA